MRYPNLKNSKIISFDIETYDPELIKKGPGVYRKDGMIVGCGIANESGFAEYYNLGHPGISKSEKEKNMKYLREVLALPNKKLGTNILYDLDWLINGYDFEVNGEWHDIQVSEPLIDENLMSYSLDAQAKKYLGRGKYKDELIEFCERHGYRDNVGNHIWEMPYETVRKYSIEDVVQPIEIFTKQWTIMYEQDLLDLYRMEMGLFPLLLQMRRTGVRIDTEGVNKAIVSLSAFLDKTQEEMWAKYGKFNYNSSKQIARILDKLHIPYNLTAKGNPNLDKDTLKDMHHELTEKILELRSAYKTRGTFLINSFTEMNVNGRIHSEFHPLRSDDYGTISGRFSSTNPNLQQIINKDNPYGHGLLCRSLFIPEEGCIWGKIDWSQIEYRFIAHYATGPKSDEIRAKYSNDPTTDYHAMIMEWTGTNRSDAKRLNFGAAYAMGAATSARKFGWSYEEAEELLQRYHEEVPFVRYTRNRVVKVAKGRGYIKTILGRRARVTDAMRAERKEYSLFNRLIQGSAADLMKKAMLDCYNAGLFNVLIPHLTVHDELDMSIPKTKEGMEAFKETKRIMENCIELKVPIVADAEIGPNWADLHKLEEGWLFDK